MKKLLATTIASVVFALSASAFAAPATKQVYTVAYSHYIGWEPVALMDKNGTLKKWANKYGVEIKVTPPMAYGDSLEQFNGGAFHAVTVTNMDALTAFNSVESEAIIVGDYSNGNDGIVLRDGKTTADIAGRKVQLVQGTVSQYLLHRTLAMNHIPPKSVKLVNVADENAIVSAFNENADKKAAVVTWNPFLVDVRNAKGSTMVADSSKIPGEIVDMIVVRKDAPEAFKKALAGAWYETVALVEHGGPERMKAMQFFATAMGQTVPQTEAQLRTTAMFYTPKAASEFTEAADLKRVMGLIQSFAKEATAQGTMSAKGAENVGIKFPDGTVIGNSKNVRLIFSSTYMRMAEKGELK
jgi:NitT/TauT family transport system substrate-binding protein